MRRVAIAFLIAPLIVSIACFGAFAAVAYPLFMSVTVVLGIPLFLLFRSRGWLAWWHAILVGIACSSAGMALDLNSPVRLDIYGPQEVIAYVAMGSGVGLLFWFIRDLQERRISPVSGDRCRRASSGSCPWSPRHGRRMRRWRPSTPMPGWSRRARSATTTTLVPLRK